MTALKCHQEHILCSRFHSTLLAFSPLLQASKWLPELQPLHPHSRAHSLPLKSCTKPSFCHSLDSLELSGYTITSPHKPVISTISGESTSCLTASIAPTKKDDSNSGIHAVSDNSPTSGSDEALHHREWDLAFLKATSGLNGTTEVGGGFINQGSKFDQKEV